MNKVGIEGYKGNVSLESLHSMLEALRKDVEDMNETRALEVVEVKKRLAELEERISKIPTSTQKTESDVTQSRLERLDKLLFSHHPVGISFSDLGKLLEFGVNRRVIMSQFGKVLQSMPDKYIVEDSRGNEKRVRLNSSWLHHLEIQREKEFY